MKKKNSDQALIELYLEDPKLKKAYEAHFGAPTTYKIDWELNTIFIEGSRKSGGFVLSSILNLIKKGHGGLQ